jgi:glucokinase
MPTLTYKIGIDIGGTKMSAVLYNGSKVIADYILATPKDTIEHFIIMLQALVEPLLERAKADKAKVTGIGMGVAGVHNYREGKVLISPNIPLINNQKLPSMLSAKVGLSVQMDNDANCFARAEAIEGAGKGYKNIYGIIVGTGIGGGWWFNNDIYLGSHGGAGEPGATIINAEAKVGLEEAFHKLTQNSPAAMAEKAFRGDVLAQKAFDEFGDILGVALANIVNLIDPEIIVIGGGVIESSELFLSRVRKTMKDLVESTESKKIKVVKSKLGPLSGAIGAALLVTHNT